jgi:acetyl esterase/lipase
MIRPRLLFTLVAPWLVLGAPAAAQQPKKTAEPKVPPGVAYEKDIEYGRGGETPLHLDLARPEKTEGALPVVVFIHGGGWRAGNYKAHVQQILQFAQQGYVSATVQYRFAPAHPWPAQIEDVKCAIRYLRDNAEKHHLDPKRIGAVGFSAGAHLSMLLGVMDEKDGLEGSGGHVDQSSKVQAVVAYFGPTDLSQEDFPDAVDVMLRDFLGGTKQQQPAAYKAASPVTYVDKDDAPMLLFQGTKDVLVPYNQAYLMCDAMTTAGLPGRVELLLGANHGWGGTEIVRTGIATEAFFREHLKKK